MVSVLNARVLVVVVVAEATAQSAKFVTNLATKLLVASSASNRTTSASTKMVVIWIVNVRTQNFKEIINLS
jgi:hypothetical protein